MVTGYEKSRKRGTGYRVMRGPGPRFRYELRGCKANTFKQRRGPEDVNRSTRITMHRANRDRVMVIDVAIFKLGRNEGKDLLVESIYRCKGAVNLLRSTRAVGHSRPGMERITQL